ncbi:hypothetical protein [Vreelandella sp. TE19]
MEHDAHEENSLVLAAEDFDLNSFEEFHFFTAQDRKNISKLRAHGPVLLKGARGSGKSALMIEAHLGLYPKNEDSNVIGVYVSLRHLELLRSTGDAYIKLLCKLIAREANRSFDKEVLPTTIESIFDLQDELTTLSVEEDKRLVLFFDDAAHIGREANLNDFFDAFRTLSNSYISCKASIYPGVTRFGTRFDIYNDATVIDVNRSEKLPDFSKVFEEVVERRFSNSLSQDKFSKSLSKQDFCDLVGQSVLGNMRAFIFACNEIISIASESKNIAYSHISESFKQLSSNYFWPLLEEIKPKLGMYEAMVDPAEHIALLLFEKVGGNNERAVIILREICHKYSKPIEILEYIGFISRREVSRVMKSRGRGTRYMLNVCILSEYMPNGRISSDDYEKWKSSDEKALEFHRGSELLEIELPEVGEDHDLDILRKPISILSKSNAYPYGLTELMIQKLEEKGIGTIENLLEIPDEEITEIERIGEKTLKRIRSTTNQAVWM